ARRQRERDERGDGHRPGGQRGGRPVRTQRHHARSGPADGPTVCQLRRPGAEGRDRRQLISGILLAAGLSSRFGRQKLLEPWRGEALVRRAARSFLEAGLAPVIAVVSGDRHLADALAGLPVTIETNPQPERGINTSIRIGVGALPRATTAALIGVADQPLLT